MASEMLASNAVLIGIELLAASVWVGGLICLVTVAGAARQALDADAQVLFFRSLGKRYGIVGTVALAIALGVGFAMIWPPSSWDSLDDTVVALSGFLVVVTALGIRQARWMTRLRRQGLESPTNSDLAQRVLVRARAAFILRAVIACVSLSILAVVAVMIGG